MVQKYVRIEVVEAIMYTSDTTEECMEFCPGSFVDEMGNLRFNNGSGMFNGVSIGDYIVKESDGSFHTHVALFFDSSHLAINL